MFRKSICFLVLGVAAVGQSSCVLIRAPFAIAGAVVEGTYTVGEKAVTAPIDAYERRKERKEAEQEKKDKEAEKAGKTKPHAPATPPGAQPTPLPEPLPLPDGELPPIPPPS